MSALSTVLFVLGAGWVVALGSRRIRRVGAWTSLGAFVVNAHWIRFSERIGLRVEEMGVAATGKPLAVNNWC